LEQEKSILALNDSIVALNKATHVAHWLQSTAEQHAEIATNLFGKIDHDGSPMLKIVLSNNSSVISLSEWTLLVLLEQEAGQKQLTHSFPLELEQGATWKRRIHLNSKSFIGYSPLIASVYLCFANGASAERGFAMQLHQQRITVLDFVLVEPVSGASLLHPANRAQRRVTSSLMERL
jgi:hypothetical protein